MDEEINIRNKAETIARNFELSIKQRTDKLLELNAIAHSNLGIDSTITEKKKVKTNSRYIFNQIKGIDERLGKLLVGHMDK